MVPILIQPVRHPGPFRHAPRNLAVNRPLDGSALKSPQVAPHKQPTISLHDFLRIHDTMNGEKKRPLGQAQHTGKRALFLNRGSRKNTLYDLLFPRRCWPKLLLRPIISPQKQKSSFFITQGHPVQLLLLKDRLGQVRFFKLLIAVLQIRIHIVPLCPVSSKVGYGIHFISHGPHHSLCISGKGLTLHIFHMTAEKQPH